MGELLLARSPEIVRSILEFGFDGNRPNELELVCKEWRRLINEFPRWEQELHEIAPGEKLLPSETSWRQAWAKHRALVRFIETREITTTGVTAAWRPAPVNTERSLTIPIRRFGDSLLFLEFQVQVQHSWRRLIITQANAESTSENGFCVEDRLQGRSRDYILLRKLVNATTGQVSASHCLRGSRVLPRTILTKSFVFTCYGPEWFSGSSLAPSSAGDWTLDVCRVCDDEVEYKEAPDGRLCFIVSRREEFPQVLAAFTEPCGCVTLGDLHAFDDSLIYRVTAGRHQTTTSRVRQVSVRHDGTHSCVWRVVPPEDLEESCDVSVTGCVHFTPDNPFLPRRRTRFMTIVESAESLRAAGGYFPLNLSPCERFLVLVTSEFEVQIFDLLTRTRSVHRATAESLFHHCVWTVRLSADDQQRPRPFLLRLPTPNEDNY